MKILLSVGWKDRVPGSRGFEVKYMQRLVDLPFVPRKGDLVESWDAEYREVEEVRVPTGGRPAELELEVVHVHANPDAAEEAMNAAQEAGWTEQSSAP